MHSFQCSTLKVKTSIDFSRNGTCITNPEEHVAMYFCVGGCKYNDQYPIIKELVIHCSKCVSQGTNFRLIFDLYLMSFATVYFQHFKF